MIAFPETRWSRRRFLAAGAVAAAAAALPGGSLRAQTAQYTRYNVASPEGKRMLSGYAAAIRTMLQKDPADPHNWYRNTLVHTLDCPHGNWWFLPWHRGYLGYFEQTVRKYSGMSDFAFPYWDWTTQPEIPAEFFGANNSLDPTSSLYIKSYAEFKAQFTAPVDALYAGFSAGQNQDLEARGMQTAQILWGYIDPANPQGGFFAPGDSARCLTAAAPAFAQPPTGCNGCSGTPKAVSEPTIVAALAPDNFVDFGSGIVDQHSSSTQQGVLESEPHNLVHNCIGGFMQDLMSPVDPIFFMHHSNIERLWLVWADKQAAMGKPPWPQGADADGVKWSEQPFRFYIDANGATLSKVAGDFATVGSFDYTYTPGTGTPMIKSAKARASQHFKSPAAMPADLVKEAGASENGPELFAEVKIDPQGGTKGKTFHVLIDPPAGLDPTDTSSPHHAASFAFFGSGHGHGHGAITFMVPLSPALRKLQAAGKLKAGAKIQLFLAVEDKKAKGKAVAKPVEATIVTH